MSNKVNPLLRDKSSSLRYAVAVIGALAVNFGLWSGVVAQVNNPGLFQSGAVTAGHCTSWGPGAGQLQDAGAACAATPPTGANPSATAGPTAVNGAAATFMRSDAAPAVQLGTNAQKGIVQVDGTSVTAVAGVITATLPTSANPTATASTSAVNGVAATYMRSDAAPAVSATTFGGQSVGPGGTAGVQGNGAKIQLSTGAVTSNNCAKFDANGNTVDAGATCGTAGVTSFNGQTGAITGFFAPQARVTLTSGTAVMSTSVAAATTVYVTPSAGNMNPVYDGSNTRLFALAELSIVLGANWTLNSNWDVFIADDAGTKRACTGPAWTSDTARGSGAATTELERFSGNGLWTNKNSMTCRYNNTTTFTVAADQGTYIGSFRTGSAGQANYIFGTIAANGGAASLNVCNAYTKADVATMVGDSTDSWNYAVGGTVRAANGSTTARVSMLRCLDDEVVTANYNAISSSTGVNSYAGVCVDVTNAFVAAGGNSGFNNSTGAAFNLPAMYSGFPGLGFHFVSACEATSGATSTYYGDNGAPLFFQSGFHVRTRQ